MIKALWLIVLTIAIIYMFRKTEALDKELEEIKTWEPFDSICKIRIPDEDD